MLLMMFSLNLTTAFKLSISECISLKNKKDCYCLRGDGNCVGGAVLRVFPCGK